jgi:hypothetical protein
VIMKVIECATVNYILGIGDQIRTAGNQREDQS